MHFSNLVICPKDETGKKSLSEIVAPVVVEGNEEHSSDGWWDWYQVGGRWTGFFDGYDPELDPNLKGKDGKTTWPTQWPERKEDAIQIKDLTQEQVDRAYAVVLPDGERYASERYVPGPPNYPWKEMPYQPGRFEPCEKPPVDWLKKTYPGHIVVIVDNHN